MASGGRDVGDLNTAADQAVADALEFNPAFSHVECYVPGPDEQGVVMDVAGTVIAMAVLFPVFASRTCSCPFSS